MIDILAVHIPFALYNRIYYEIAHDGYAMIFPSECFIILQNNSTLL